MTIQSRSSMGWAGPLVVLLLVLAASVPGQAARLEAATPTPPVDGAAVGAILLAEAVAETTLSPGRDGVFFQGTIDLSLSHDAIRLASSPDGGGLLCTDDRATITFSAATSRAVVWSHTFASRDRRQIVCIPPQTIHLPGGAGRYRVTIVLEDIYPPVHSSRPYYLIAETPASPSRGAQPAATIVPTEAATISVAQAPPDIQPTLPAPTIVRTATPLPALTIEPDPATPVPLLALALAGLAGLLGLALFVRAVLGQRRAVGPALALAGILDLTDRSTGEVRTLLLHRYPRGAGIVRQPLELVSWPATTGARPVVAVIVPDARGPLLRTLDAEQPAAVPLRKGEQLLLDRVIEVRYRP